MEMSGEVVVYLYDLTGSKVAQLYSGYAESGNRYSTELDAGDLKAGVYIIQVVSENAVMYERVAILK